MIGVFAAAIMMRGVAVVTYMVFLALLHNHTHLVMMMVMRHEGGYQNRQQQYRHDYVAKSIHIFIKKTSKRLSARKYRKYFCDFRSNCLILERLFEL